MSEIDKAEETGELVDGPTSAGSAGIQAQLEISRAASLLRFATVLINDSVCEEFFESCAAWLKRNGEENCALNPELESWLILKMLGQRDEEK
jgi:hypothetical protein